MPKKNHGMASAERSKQTSQKLIDVAVDLFSRKGFKATSIREIATEMGMTTSNIYHHYGTKAGLLSAIEKDTLTPLLDELEKIKELDMPPEDRLILLIKTHLRFMNAHRKETKIFTFFEGESELSKKYQVKTYTIYRSEIQRLAESTGRKIDVSVATLCTLGTVIWFLRWYSPDGRLSIEEILKNITDYVLNGIMGNGNNALKTKKSRSLKS